MEKKILIESCIDELTPLEHWEKTATIYQWVKRGKISYTVYQELMFFTIQQEVKKSQL